jgi:hypothetical protein
VKAGGCGVVGLALLVGGCHSTVDVRKVGPDDYETRGVRYSLPKPFLKVVPASDGTVTVEVEYLPDLAHTYAIDAETTLGKHKLEVMVDKGLLTSVVFDPDTAAVGKQAVSSGAAIADSLLQAEAEREKARKEERKTEAAEAKTRLDTLEKAVDDAVLEVRKAEARVTALQAAGASADAIRQAEVELAVAQATLAVAQDRLDAELAVRKATEDDLLGRAPERRSAPQAASGDEGAPPQGPCHYHGPLEHGCLECTSPGPVFYAIDERAGCRGASSIALRAVNGPMGAAQACFRTGRPPPEKPKPPPPELSLDTPDGTALTFPATTRVDAAQEALRLADKKLTLLKAAKTNDPSSVSDLDFQAQVVAVVNAEIVLAEAKRPRFTLVTNRTVSSIRTAALSAVVGNTPPTAKLALAVLSGPMTIQFELASGTPKGRYWVDLDLRLKSPIEPEGTPAQGVVQIDVASDVP